MTVRKSFYILTSLAILSATAASAYTGQALEKSAKIDLAHATAIAIRARAGKITDKELEREAGGSGLRYSFDVVANKVTYEVGVDAQTGAVLENQAEGANPD